MRPKRSLCTYIILGCGVWGGLILGMLTLAFFFEKDPLLHAVAGMVCGLGYLWIVCGGLLMWRFREPICAFVRRIPLDGRLKFVLFATLLALLEEVVTTTMTNLAPLFGVPVGKVYITASANYLDVVLFHSVIVLIPEFIVWAWLLSRFDFSPDAVFVLYGLAGMLGETLAFGPQNIVMLGFWMFVYGLMVYLPAYAFLSEKVRRKPRLPVYLLALVLPFVPVIPVAVGIFQGLKHPSIHFPPMQPIQQKQP